MQPQIFSFAGTSQPLSFDMFSTELIHFPLRILRIKFTACYTCSLQFQVFTTPSVPTVHQHILNSGKPIISTKSQAQFFQMYLSPLVIETFKTFDETPLVITIVTYNPEQTEQTFGAVVETEDPYENSVQMVYPMKDGIIQNPTHVIRLNTAKDSKYAKDYCKFGLRHPMY